LFSDFVILATINIYESDFNMNPHEISIGTAFSIAGMSTEDQAKRIVSCSSSMENGNIPSASLAANHIDRPVKEIFVTQKDGLYYIFCAKTLLMGSKSTLDSQDFFTRIELASTLGMNALAHGQNPNLTMEDGGKIDLFGAFDFDQAVGFVETVLLLNFAYETRHEAEKTFKQTAPDGMRPK
jgi:hypothetical protein